MSLIITSSNVTGETNQLQVDAPYHYRNDFRSGMKIPANSQIAVESCKINRQPTLDYESGAVCNFWMGQRLNENASYENSLSYIIPSINNIKRNLNPQDFSEEFVKIMKEAYSLHPEIDSVNGVTMDPVLDTNGGFKGFRFNVNQIGASATSLIPASGTEKLIFGVLEDYDAGVFESGADDAYVQLQPSGSYGGPISLFDGEAKFENFTGSGSWVVGLARPLINSAPDGDIEVSNFQIPMPEIEGEGLGPDEDQFYDYAVESRDGVIKLYHAVPNPDAEGGTGETFPGLVMREIKYYNKSDSATTAGNASNSSFIAANAPINSASITDITFKIENEKVTISASGKLLCAANKIDSASFKDQVPKPLNQSCWKMYPTVGLYVSGDEVELTSYRCRTDSTIHKNIIPNHWGFKCRVHADMDTVFHQAVDANGDYIPFDPWNNAWNWVEDLENRPIMKRFLDSFGATNEPHTSPYVRDYKALNASTMDSYEPIMIGGKTERYTSTVIQEWQPNVTNILGFQPFAIAPFADSVTVASGQASFVSAARPTMTSESSTFIRVPTFTHKTFNFGTGNPSKILFQIPRFDNSGAETGALYFQNQDKAYIDLNNPQDITVTDLDVHFIRKDEKFAKDLTGSSEVVFYVRDKPKM
jgi:hypothetical protein